MEEKHPSAFQATLFPGLMLGLSLIVFSLIMYVIGVEYDSRINWLSYLIIAGFLYWSMATYRDKSMGGFASYGSVFKAGFFTLLVATVILAIYTYVYVTYINPGFIDDILLKQEEELLRRSPNMSDKELETAMSVVSKFSSPAIITVSAAFFNLLFGTVISLLIAIFVRREKSSPA